MDTLTHGLLGATLAQATFGKRLGWKSLIVGALAALIPDIDMIASLAGPMAEFKWHRSITHTFWFGPLLAWFASLYLSKRYPETRRWDWFWLLVIVVSSHPFLDICTSYGTQFWAPFSDIRLKWNTISVIDFGYTGILLLTVLAGLWAGIRPSKRWQLIGILGLVSSFSYLNYCRHIQATFEARVEEMGPWTYAEVHPTLFQPWMRHVYATKKGRVCVTYLHYTQTFPVAWKCRPQEFLPIVTHFLATTEAQIFDWYAGHNIYVEHDSQRRKIRIHDIRYSLPTSPFEGVWGIEVTYDPLTHVFSPITHFRGTRQINWTTLKDYIQIVIGHQPWT